MTTRKQKHLTLDDRIAIQEGLLRNTSFRAIAASVGKDPSTISKEVRRNATEHLNKFVTLKETCPNLSRAPFVCNGCRLKSSPSCHYRRRVYSAKAAQQLYRERLVSSREGIALNKQEFYENDRILSSRIKAGQHLNQVLPELSFSRSSAYRYLQKGYLSVCRLDFPRVVKFKPRRKKPAEYVPKKLKVGRSYEDFLSYVEENGIDSHVELDTVIGRIGGKVIMTVHFTDSNFMFGLLLEDRTSAEAASKVKALKARMLDAGLPFGSVFPVLLTDNGGEFADVFSFEQDLEGNDESKLFFCDPMKSCQKPYIEKNHTLFRDIVPKGVSFDSFTQETVNLIFSHVNSVRRAKFHNRTPFEMFSFLQSEDLPGLFGIKEIAPQEVIQTPRLRETPEFLRTLK